jgi:hypothetical protein
MWEEIRRSMYTNTEGKLCLVVREVVEVTQSPPTLTPRYTASPRYTVSSSRYTAGTSFREKGCCWGYIFLFCSVYLEIKISDLIANLSFRALEGGAVP